MRICVLPPWFYPHKAYFDLIRDVDQCVLFTDTHYAKRRFITRSKIRDNKWLSVPVIRPSERMPINEVKMMPFEQWHPAMCERLCDVYGRKYVDGHPVFEDFKKLPTGGDNLSYLLYKSLKSILKYCNIWTPLYDSREFPASKEHGQDRIIEICKYLGANEYRSIAGGRKEYDYVAFERHGLRLSYMEPPTTLNKLSMLDEAFSWAWE